jgi:hypothetical protein
MFVVAVSTPFSVTAFAQDLNTTETKIDLPSGFHAGLEMSYDAYPEASNAYFGGDEKSSGLSTIGASVVGNSRGNYVDAKWFYSGQEGDNYFDVKELSHNFSNDKYDMWVGRHLEEWSEADSFWRLGYWQPRFNWDELRPDENGFTGVFVAPTIIKPLRLMVFATPLFVPELNQDYSEQNGRVVSNNPWFKTPPPIVDLFNSPTPVNLSVNAPSISDVVFEPSFAVRGEIRAENKSWARISYAYKPMNTPLMAYSYAVQESNSTSTMEVVAQPQFIYHHIATVESQFASHVGSGDLAIVPSLTYDDPQVKALPDQWIAQDMNASLIGSITATWRPEDSKHDSIYTGVMYDWTTFPPDRGENAQGVSEFQLRPVWISALRVGYEHSQERAHGNILSYGVEGTVDPLQNGGELLSQVRYKFDKRWQAKVRADLIGIFSEASNNYDTGFIQTYHSNSTVGMDVSYVY